MSKIFCRKDGFNNNYERAYYYWKQIGLHDYEKSSITYTSTSIRTKGSPMITIKVSHENTKNNK